MDLDLFNLPAMVEAVRQCRSFTLSAIGHTDDEMVFDLNADMFCSTPHAAGSAIQKHLNILRKTRQNYPVKNDEPGPKSAENKTFVGESIPHPESRPMISGLQRIQRLSYGLGQWAWHSARIVFFLAVILFFSTVLLQLLKSCALPAAKIGKEIWEQVKEQNADRTYKTKHKEREAGMKGAENGTQSQETRHPKRD